MSDDLKPNSGCKCKAIIIVLCFLTGLYLQAQNTSNTLADKQVLDLIAQNRPLKNGSLPSSFKKRIGATHMDGQYCFTREPFIIEGAKKLNELGYGILKLWLDKTDGNAKGYGFNSDWQLSKSMTLSDLAAHPYFQEVFDLPFSTFALNINEGYGGASTDNQAATLKRVEDEFYDLTKYLLTKYRKRKVTFILEMWEGDWTLRGGTQPLAKWKENGVPADAQIRVKNMIDWIDARQKGVDRARTEIKHSKCIVYHAVEVNKVFDGIEGIPSITTSVLPNVKVDMVSWSSYDGKTKDGLMMYRGIDIIRQYMVPSTYMKGKKIVFIGEIGEAENVNNNTRDSIREFWDTMLGVFIAKKIPYIIHWELYCNEPKQGPRSQERNKATDELRGFWLIRPDGSKSWAQEYFDDILSMSNHGK